MASKRGKQTVRGMFLSMAVATGAAGFAYIFIPHGGNANPVPAIDYRVELLTARHAAPYPVAAPDGLAKDWKPTSVSYDHEKGSSWHLGFLDPDGKYVAVEQSTSSPVDKYVTEVSQDAKDTGRTQQVAGEAWQHWKGDKYDALVRQDKDTTTVVTGSASTERLAEMAAALKGS
ncbi:DUF4245 domain-containing protein [Streptomyces sp. NPDC052042]|uniref:DUF4245 domain-containing protein n=1 Tax=Streptomyces sp. NPDC052042 TaxID=3365683 RepID=UPI0037D0D734